MNIKANKFFITFDLFQMLNMDVVKSEPQSHHHNSTAVTTNAANNGNPQQVHQQHNNNPSQLCAGCGKNIQDRFLLRALDLLWHEDCLK